MKSKTLNSLKHFLYIGLLFTVLFLLTVFLIVLFGFGDSLLVDIFGSDLIYVFIVIPILIGLSSLFLKYIRKLSFKKTILYSIIAILIYIFAVVGTHTVAEYHFKTFTLEKWTAYPYQRYRMLDDVTSKYYFIGMSDEDVVEILGEPNFINLEDSEGVIDYVVRSLFIDSEYVRFSIENGVVTDAYIYNDDLKDYKQPIY